MSKVKDIIPKGKEDASMDKRDKSDKAPDPKETGDS